MLLNKMIRELIRNKTQFISIFLMIFIGIFIYSGLNAVGQGMDQSSKNFYADTNLADAVLYGENFTEDDIKLLGQEDGITKAELRLQVNASLARDSKTTVQLNFVQSNLISANHCIAGEEFNSNKEGLWLNSSFADANSYEVGDTIELEIQGKVRSLTILGLIMNPEYVYAIKDENEVLPNHKLYGYAYLSTKEFDLLPELPFNQIILDTDWDKNGLNDIIENVFQTKHIMLVMQEDQRSVSMFRNEVNQMKAMQTIFPIVFLLIAVLTTLTTMTRITMSQRTQIGTLKAVGFSNNKILRHYTSYGTSIGILGGILGFITGPILLPKLVFSFQMGFYTMPEWNGSISVSVFLMTIFCIAGCGLSGFMACRKELYGATAEILRPKAPKVGKHTSLEKSKWWNKLKFDFQWNIRDLLRNKMRSLITILGIIGCMALILCALGMRDTVQGITDTSYTELNSYDNKVTLSESISLEGLLELKEDDELQFIQEMAIEIDLADEYESMQLTVIGKGDYIKHKDRNDNFIILPDSGVVITNKISEIYGLNIGDILKWRIYGTKDWTTEKITEIIRTPLNQGVFISEEAYQRLKLTMRPTAFLTKGDGGKYSGVDFNSIQTRDELVKSMDTLMETMNVMIFVLILAAIVLGLVVLYNLGVLSFHERVRELTTLKVLGFQYAKLRKLLQTQNIWLTLFGTILGIPSGYLLLYSMLEFMGDSFDMIPTISFLSLVCSILGTLLLSVIVNWFLSLKLKTIDMVSALKSVD